MIERDDETKEGNKRTLASVSFSSAADAVAAVKRTFFSCFDSGWYLFNCVAVFLSSVCENWAMAGGTLRRWCRMTFCLWRRTYSGHLTKLVRSVWGRMSWPGPQAEFQEYQERDDDTTTHRYQKFLALASNKGFFFAFVVLLAPKGAAAGFLPVPDLALGWSLRRSDRCYPFSSREKEKTIALRSSNAVRTARVVDFIAQWLSRERVSTDFHAVLFGKVR